jgi:hypothetical protein
MPFTFAHPAAAIPLNRFLGNHGSVTALVIGSMAPDLPFFLGILIPRTYTHSLLGLITWALPAGLVVLAMFHFLLRDALLALAPTSVQGRLALASRTSQPGLMAVTISLLAGSVTHVIWDSFTHPGTVVVRSLPILQISWGRIGEYELYIFKLLQHLSSMIGLSLLIYWGWRWFNRAASCDSPPMLLSVSMRRGICAILLNAPLVAGGCAVWLSGRGASRVAAFVFTVLPTFFWMMTAFALVWRIVRQKPTSNFSSH